MSRRAENRSENVSFSLQQRFSRICSLMRVSIGTDLTPNVESFCLLLLQIFGQREGGLTPLINIVISLITYENCTISIC